MNIAFIMLFLAFILFVIGGADNDDNLRLGSQIFAIAAAILFAIALR